MTYQKALSDLEALEQDQRVVEYVQGLMNEQQRALFEQQISSDSRLRELVEQERLFSQQLKPAQVSIEPTAGSLHQLHDKIKMNQRRHWFIQGGIAASALALIFTSWQLYQPELSGTYQTLSNDVQTVVSDQQFYQLILSQSMTKQELTEFLSDNNLQLIRGSSTPNQYVVAFSDEKSSITFESVQQSDAVILFEPMLTTDR